ncbi:hypothetical protein [Streptomyces rubiginosohelvolus]|uniref:hypothetical protein n=1 Tax=Streptomyces rubiginosohelvolus TaxID=67362 RepID=UPI0035DA5C4B
MTTAARMAEHPQPVHTFVVGAYNSLAYVPRMPPTAYALFLWLVSMQSPGGEYRRTQGELADELALERTQISKAQQHLVAARLVISVGRGRYQLNPMVSGYTSVDQQRAAIESLPAELRLDVGDYEDLYEQRLEEQEKLRARKAARRSSAPRVVRLADRRPSPQKAKSS